MDMFGVKSGPGLDLELQLKDLIMIQIPQLDQPNKSGVKRKEL